jgi:hypothetical protein
MGKIGGFNKTFQFAFTADKRFSAAFELRFNTEIKTARPLRLQIPQQGRRTLLRGEKRQIDGAGGFADAAFDGITGDNLHTVLLLLRRK